MKSVQGGLRGNREFNSAAFIKSPPWGSCAGGPHRCYSCRRCCCWSSHLCHSWAYVPSSCRTKVGASHRGDCTGRRRQRGGVSTMRGRGLAAPATTKASELQAVGQTHAALFSTIPACPHLQHALAQACPQLRQQAHIRGESHSLGNIFLNCRHGKGKGSDTQAVWIPVQAPVAAAEYEAEAMLPGPPECATQSCCRPTAVSRLTPTL